MIFWCMEVSLTLALSRKRSREKFSLAVI